MYNRILKLPLEGRSSLFLFGPRGTGKTSWIKKYMPNALYLDLLHFPTYSSFSAHPQRLENIVPHDWRDWVVLDEIQRIPELLNQVHRLIESRGIRFLLTGSSARSLRRNGVNLLAGRALTYHMHPLIIQELGTDFRLERALRYGLLPAAVSHENPHRYLASYVQTYVQEEVLQEGLTRDIGAFNRFLEIASFSQGQVLNVSEIARELSLGRLLVASYFDILEDLLLAVRIPVFTKRAKRKMTVHKKFYLFDTGVYKILRPTGILDTQQELDGAGLETLFLQSLQAVNDYFNLGYGISFWRTESGAEVDFIIYGPHGFHAFEIKRSAQITNKNLASLKKFHLDYPEAQLHMLYLGDHKQYYGTIQVLPFVEALRNLPQIIGQTGQHT